MSLISPDATDPNKLSRRVFVSRLSAAGVGLAVADQLQFASADTARASPLSELDRFNYVIGTQTFSPLYQFTARPRLVETAQAIRQMGSSVIKLRLRPEQGDGPEAADNRRLPEVAEKNPVIREILEMPFSHFILWAYSQDDGRGKGKADDSQDEEIYELTCYLLRRFDRTGKSFYLGHWEGDWEMRGTAGGSNDPPPAAISRKIDWLNRRQRAVDQAKRHTSHEDVNVYCYAEANRVADSMRGRPGMINAVVPHTNIDFVSYSSYDTTADRPTGLAEVLDYMESQLPPKQGIAGKRVWIGEYGYPISKFSPAEQDQRSRELIKAAVRWGCPFVLYWEMYNNELDKNGKQRGFWLIDDKGAKQPVYYTHERSCKWGRNFVTAHLKKKKRVPAFDEYRKGLLEYLDRM